jgi:hypothetical protein
MLVLLLEEFGSVVEDVMVEVALIEAAVIVGARFTTIKILADDPEARLDAVQLMLPVAPTVGVVQAHPAGIEIDAKVVFVGTASVKLRFEAVAGPLLVTV